MIMHIRTQIISMIQAIVFVITILLTVMPVEVRLSDVDTYLCVVAITIGLAGLFCLIYRKSENRITVVDGLVTLWTIYYFCRIWIGAEYPCAIDFLESMEMVLLYFLLRFVLQDCRIPVQWLIGGFCICGLYESALGAYQLITGSGRHDLFVLTGSFLNPGPYSAYLMVTVVMGVIYNQTNFDGVISKSAHMVNLIKESTHTYSNKVLIDKICKINKIRYYVLFLIQSFSLIGGWMALLIIPATWSRAAFVGLCICALWRYRKVYWKYRWIVWGALLVLAVGFYFFKRGSADGRTLIWIASVISWLHEPWFGVGVGGFCHACAEGIAEIWTIRPNSAFFDSGGVADYAYNSLIGILVEQGVVGFVICITTVGVAMWRLKGECMTLFVAMVALLIFSMFSYPFELLPYRIMLVLVFAWSESVKKGGVCLPVNKMMSIFVCLIITTLCWLLREEVMERIERDKEVRRFSSMQNAAFLSDYYELLPYETDNSLFLFDFAQTLRKECRYRDSNAILYKGVLVSADPLFYTLIGNNYRDDKMYGLAENAYMKAYSVMPNRLYPLYQLMMMFVETGNKCKAYNMAMRIKESKIKIESKATLQMREKADSIAIAVGDKCYNNH